jgi:sugar/nucleoside kinase (ribokinase family)
VKKEKIIISGTGCALADYLYTGVSFDGPRFEKYRSRRPGDGGLSPGKLVFTEEIEKFAAAPYPSILKELTDNREPDGFNIGGPGLVSMIHASQLLGRDDFEVRFHGITGRDKTASLILDLARKIPLNISDYKPLSHKPTPFTHVLSDETYHNGQGERTFINNMGAAWDYTPEMLREEFFHADIVCFGGTALLPVIHDNLFMLLKKAKDQNCLTVVNTVFDFRHEKNSPDQPWPLGDKVESFKLMDLLIMDREEAIRISGSTAIDQAAAFFMESGVASFIITNGANESLAYSDGRVFRKKDLARMPVSRKVDEDLHRDPSIKGDTTGCGDNFAGGAIASLAWQLKTSGPGEFDFNDTIAWAMASGGFACFYLGGTYFERTSREKFARVKVYKKDYCRQMSLQ